MSPSEFNEKRFDKFGKKLLQRHIANHEQYLQQQKATVRTEFWSIRTKLLYIVVVIVTLFVLVEGYTIPQAKASDCIPVPYPTCFSADPKQSNKYTTERGFKEFIVQQDTDKPGRHDVINYSTNKEWTSTVELKKTIHTIWVTILPFTIILVGILVILVLKWSKSTSVLSLPPSPPKRFRRHPFFETSTFKRRMFFLDQPKRGIRLKRGRGDKRPFPSQQIPARQTRQRRQSGLRVRRQIKHPPHRLFWGDPLKSQNGR